MRIRIDFLWNHIPFRAEAAFDGDEYLIRFQDQDGGLDVFIEGGESKQKEIESGVIDDNIFG